MWPGPALDARPLDRGQPQDEETEGGNQPGDKSLIDRRLSLRSQLCAAPAEAKAKLGDFGRGHPRLFDVSFSVQFPYGKIFRARYPGNYLI
jgi:hypothetical protein